MNRRTFLKTASLAGASAAVLSETVKAGASLSSV
ncbi:MAG: twin-arginine translocation signal domain-containing protein, partial [Ignavibacteriales bacterium]|nr:twin-arginine translocation signal domain-containing protein [Ignavibacteriales bacterium]